MKKQWKNNKKTMKNNEKTNVLQWTFWDRFLGLRKTNFNRIVLTSWHVYYLFLSNDSNQLTLNYLCVGILTSVIPKTFINIRTSWIWNPSGISWFTAAIIIPKSVITVSVSPAVAQGYRRMSKQIKIRISGSPSTFYFLFEPQANP